MSSNHVQATRTHTISLQHLRFSYTRVNVWVMTYSIYITYLQDVSATVCGIETWEFRKWVLFLAQP